MLHVCLQSVYCTDTILTMTSLFYNSNDYFLSQQYMYDHCRDTFLEWLFGTFAIFLENVSENVGFNW